MMSKRTRDQLLEGLSVAQVREIPAIARFLEDYILGRKQRGPQ